MRTECNPVSMRFARLKGCDVVADFGGGTMTPFEAAGLRVIDPWKDRAARC